MAKKQDPVNKERRNFLRLSVLGTAGAVAAGSLLGSGEAKANTEPKHLQVWSCGGLAEGMMPANQEYETLRTVKISYTGAFAAVLGKSLMGSGRTEVFCGRVLELAKKLRGANRMRSFIPLCFTEYVIVTPKGNPKNIAGLDDLTKPGTKIAMAPDASPPGGAAVMLLLKRSGLQPDIMKNVISRGSCVQTTVESVALGQADAMICEKRLSRLSLFNGKLDVVKLPFEVQPPGPLTFTAGIMEEAKDLELAQDYITWLAAADGGQKHLEAAGFIPATSQEGQKLIDILGVKDHA